MRLQHLSESFHPPHPNLRAPHHPHLRPAASFPLPPHHSHLPARRIQSRHLRLQRIVPARQRVSAVMAGRASAPVCEFTGMAGRASASFFNSPADYSPAWVYSTRSMALRDLIYLVLPCFIPIYGPFRRRLPNFRLWTLGFRLFRTPLHPLHRHALLFPVPPFTATPPAAPGHHPAAAAALRCEAPASNSQRCSKSVSSPNNAMPTAFNSAASTVPSRSPRLQSPTESSIWFESPINSATPAPRLLPPQPVHMPRQPPRRQILLVDGPAAELLLQHRLRLRQAVQPVRQFGPAWPSLHPPASSRAVSSTAARSFQCVLPCR